MTLQELVEEIERLPVSARTANVYIDDEGIEMDIISVQYLDGVVTIRVEENDVDES